MGLRQDFVKGMVDILGKTQFRYGSYKSQPPTPYGLYIRTQSANTIADDHVYAKANIYLIRLVTDEKDFDLELKIEDMMDELEIAYDVATEEDIEEEKVHVTEWEVKLYER